MIDMEETIYIIAEHCDGKIRQITFELLSFAAQLQKKCSLPIEVLILGENVSDMAKTISETAGTNVTALEIPGLTDYNGEVYRSVLTQFFKNRNAQFVCAGHSSQGTDFAPGLSIRMDAANITGVREIVDIEGELCFARSVYGGKRIAHVRSLTETVILNVQPGVFKPFSSPSSSPGDVCLHKMICLPEKSRFIERKPSIADTGALCEADVIVSAGNGIEDEENIGLVYDLADFFSKSAVGGSRIVCDRGWLAYGQQVGVTGATVSPKLYIACGISGAAQHLAGMSGAEFIVAINKDSRAAVMNIADVCVIEDITTFIPLLIDTLNQGSSK